MNNIYFQKHNLTIQIYSDHKKEWLYGVDLENCTNSAEILDYIFQIAAKKWRTPQILYDLIKEIEEAWKKIHGKNAQLTFCLGKNQTIKWK